VDSLYQSLVNTGCGDPFDRHVFACAIVVGLAEPERPLTVALGLPRERLEDILAAYFVDPWKHLPLENCGDGPGEDQIEEPDLRQLLIDHRSSHKPEEEWLAAIIARRSLGANHLWQDLGLFDRSELGRMMDRHFHALKLRNHADMKWKKFFYRQLCELDGLTVCKAPNCEICTDFNICFGPESGDPLSVLQKNVLDIRQTRRSD